MKTTQQLYLPQSGWKTISDQAIPTEVNLVLVFASTQLIQDRNLIAEIRSKYPHAIVCGCSTSGEIIGNSVYDDSISLTAIAFEKTEIKHASVNIQAGETSAETGKRLFSQLPKENLKHILLLSEGLNINGSDLVGSISENLSETISVTGGLAGDGADFKQTFVLANKEVAEQNTLSAIGFYGDKIHISYGSLGGWDSFGIERLVTKSDKNILYELDGQPALSLYKSFLGDHAANLPASGLLFPLHLRFDANEEPVVRTILAVDEENQSLTFAGNIPKNSYVRLMKANFDHLIEGAEGAAQKTLVSPLNENPDLAVLISCVGRKLVLKQLTEEEVEGARNVLGNHTAFCGFYSYGEISPFSKNAKCDLHNQTMTITTFKEI